MKNQKLNKTVKISILGAMAFVIMFLEIPLPVFPSFLKLDISDIPALVGAFALGPIEGVIVELLKNLLHGAIKGSSTMWVGELANFLVGSAYVYIAGFVYKRKKTRKTAILGMMLGIAAMTLTAAVFNYYVLIPFFAKLYHMPVSGIIAMATAVNPKVTNMWTLIIWSIIPFNALKGIIIAAITAPLYKKISPLFHREVVLDPNVSKNDNNVMEN